jgi:acyl-CoA synthetase (NDP forming)
MPELDQLIEVTGAERDVGTLLSPSSVAVIGASSRPGALSWWPLHLLTGNGYVGRIYPINPNRDEIEGVACYPSLAALPEVPELAMIAMNAERSLEAARECAEAGVGAVVMPTQGFGELGEEGRQKERELVELSGPGKLRIVGTNTDGVGNLATGAIASIQPLFETGIRPGPIAVATQSGATAGSLLVRLHGEGIGCRLYASAGNETDLGLADYLSVMVQDPEVKMVLSFVEALRRPKDFFAVAEMAAELGKPLALIKVGRSEQGARRAAAHTGALAGADEIYDAAFRAYGVLRVSELSELVALAKLHLGSRGGIRGRGVGILSVSGGQAGAVADKAAGRGIEVSTISPVAEASLGAALKFGKGFNPCDLTGEIATDSSLAGKVYTAFDRESDIAMIVYARKHLTGTAGPDAARRLIEAAGADGATPLAIYAMDGGVEGDERSVYDEGGAPVFANLNDLFSAMDCLAAYSEFQASRRDVPPPRREVPARAITPGAGGVVGERTVKALLADYGLDLPAEEAVSDPSAAAAAAERIGYPVVLKVLDERIPHKTEAGGVEVGLADADAVLAAYERIRAGAREYLGGGEAEAVLVQEMVGGGVELIAGIKVEPDFGPFILVGMGGVMAELLKDVALRPAPVSPAEAIEMVEGLRGAPLLHGFRGAPEADLEALGEAIAALSRLAADRADEIVELDVNPLIVRPRGEGAKVADALLFGTE